MRTDQILWVALCLVASVVHVTPAQSRSTQDEGLTSRQTMAERAPGTGSETAESSDCCDINADSQCNSTDALIILSHDVGFSVPVECLDRIQAGCGDLNADGSTNSTDALVILSWDVGFPVPYCVVNCGCPCPGESGGCPTVTDYDGNVYQTVQIGDQCWMAENLKTTCYRDGTSIPNVTDNKEWGKLTVGAYCDYRNDANTVPTYGRLYNWYTVSASAGLAPEGWHVPSDDEWKQLEMCLGMSQSQSDSMIFRGTDEGGKMKSTGMIGGHSGLWFDPNTGATNESGFSALPAGMRYGGIGFDWQGYQAMFWSRSDSSDFALIRGLWSNSQQVQRDYFWKPNGFSVRCVKDD